MVEAKGDVLPASASESQAPASCKPSPMVQESAIPYPIDAIHRRTLKTMTDSEAFDFAFQVQQPVEPVNDVTSFVCPASQLSAEDRPRVAGPSTRRLRLMNSNQALEQAIQDNLLTSHEPSSSSSARPIPCETGLPTSQARVDKRQRTSHHTSTRKRRILPTGISTSSGSSD